MRVAIIGATGVVGNATAEFFESKGIETVRYSRQLEKEGKVTKDDVNDCEVSIICVPTPMFEDKFGVDLSAVEAVMQWIDTPAIVLKSTVPPGTTRRLADEFGKSVIHNPEFLTEANAVTDMAEADRVLLGTTEFNTNASLIVVRDLYKKCYGPNVTYVVTDSDVTEMVKYMTNAFLAAKVVICNEFNEICHDIGIQYDTAREIWLLDKRVGRSHTLVSEQGGYGGMCFPKDVKGLIGFSNNPFFKMVHEENNRLRK